MDREPEEFYEKKSQQELTALVDDITTGAKNLADSVCTRDATRKRIYSECENVHVALTNLIDEYVDHVRYCLLAYIVLAMYRLLIVLYNAFIFIFYGTYVAWYIRGNTSLSRFEL